MRNINYVPRHRKRWALSQAELALLLGRRTRHAVSRCEQGQPVRYADLIFGCEFIFGVSARDLFPDHYDDLIDAILRRAAELDRSLADSTEKTAEVKRELLRQLVLRAETGTRLS